MSDNVLGVIMARGRSKRVVNKNMRRLLGKPLISYTIEHALESVLCSSVAVSTDDAKIAELADNSGVDVIRRPGHMASDTSPLEDGLRHAVMVYRQQKGVMPEITVLLQSNVPVRKKGEIDEVIRKLRETDSASAVATGYIVDQRPEWMKSINKLTGRVKPFLGQSEFYRKQDLPELVLLDGAVLAVRTEVLMATEGVRAAHGFLGDEVYVLVHESKYATEIDEEEDFELAEFYLNRIKGGHL